MQLVILVDMPQETLVDRGQLDDEKVVRWVPSWLITAGSSRSRTVWP